MHDFGFILGIIIVNVNVYFSSLPNISLKIAVVA